MLVAAEIYRIIIAFYYPTTASACVALVRRVHIGVSRIDPISQLKRGEWADSFIPHQCGLGCSIDLEVANKGCGSCPTTICGVTLTPEAHNR